MVCRFIVRAMTDELLTRTRIYYCTLLLSQQTPKVRAKWTSGMIDDLVSIVVDDEELKKKLINEVSNVSTTAAYEEVLQQLLLR